MGLFPHWTNLPPNGNQQDPIFTLGQISRHTSSAFLFPVLLFLLHARLFERALEVLDDGRLVGRLLVRLFSDHGWTYRGEIKKLRSGHGRAEVEGHLEDQALV
jgi:hypothetical protein